LIFVSAIVPVSFKFRFFHQPILFLGFKFRFLHRAIVSASFKSANDTKKAKITMGQTFFLSGRNFSPELAGKFFFCNYLLSPKGGPTAFKNMVSKRLKWEEQCTIV
jgi:hypothetical protein